MIDEKYFSENDGKDEEILTLHSGNIKVEILKSTGEIVGMIIDGLQIMHCGGKPDRYKTPADRLGWKRSEIIMFPVVGLAKDFTLEIPHGKKIRLDQHGISRYIPFSITNLSRRSAVLEQKYTSNSEIYNEKFKEGELSSRPKTMRWPYSFRIQKEISIHDEPAKDEFSEYSGSVDIDFRISNESDETMHYMFGFHPGFRTYGKSGKIIVEEGSTAEEILIRDFLGKDLTNHYKNARGVFFECSRYKMRIKSSFDGLMVWSSRDSEMICIEPVTNTQGDMESSNQILSAPKFETIAPGMNKTYYLRIFI